MRVDTDSIPIRIRFRLNIQTLLLKSTESDGGHPWHGKSADSDSSNSNYKSHSVKWNIEMMEIQLWKPVWQCDAPIGSARSRIRTIPFQSQCRWIESRSITFIERPIPNLRPG